MIMATYREDETDNLSQITPPRKVLWRDDDPMSDDYYHCPYTPPLGHHLTFTPTSTPQKADSSTDEESPSESKFETFRWKLTFSGHDANEGPPDKGNARY